MTGTRISVARLPPNVPVMQAANEDGLAEDPVLIATTSNRFGITWPTEQPPPVPLPLAVERPVILSSSEGETDVSEEELSAPTKKHPKAEEISEAEFVTPTSHLQLEQNPMDQAGRLSSQPRLSRAFSMPLPSQLEFLQNPRRMPSGNLSPVTQEASSELETYHELSLELADSVQMVIQTLLQLSPPQVLDSAKEQFSACSLSIPTPSISALFTSMKNLNYMSANMSTLTAPPRGSLEAERNGTRTPVSSTIRNDFDVGEMLQSAGDALSGVAAQAEVDLVLYHGDVGMKHISVRGDESGLSYTLSHVIRQVIATANKGDTVEVGLYIETGHEEGLPLSSGLPPPEVFEGCLRCVFHIEHRYVTQNLYATPGANYPMESSRAHPSFDTPILRRLLRHIGASLNNNIPSRGPFSGRACALTVILEPGAPAAVNPTISVSSEDAAVLGYPDMRIASEPTLEQLAQFTETLRGRKATLHANSKGSFAQHLTSYLTAWGMDVSHTSTESDADGEYERYDTFVSGSTTDLPAPPMGPDMSPSASPPGKRAVVDQTQFILIDDDVSVLRTRLHNIKAEMAYPLSLHPRKRPSLAANHRPRSSPQVARVIGMTSSSPVHSQVIIIHFTSLANFKLVKDAIQSSLTPLNGAAVRVPEIIVIPKPAGPRRFLTALHTAVTRPVVDPFFVPIATSPMSPGLHSISPFLTISSASKSPGGRSTTSRTGSERSARSPKEFIGEFTNAHAPPSPLGQPDGVEYFSDAVVKLGASPATGLLLQSPDGQPTGIIFHPKSKGSGTMQPSPVMEREGVQSGREIHPARARAYSRAPSGEEKRGNGNASSSVPPTARPSPRPTTNVSESPDSALNAPVGKGKVRSAGGSFSEDKAPPPTDLNVNIGVLSSDVSLPSSNPRFLTRRQSHQGPASSPPSSPQTRAVSGPTRRTRRTGTDSYTGSATLGSNKKSKAGDPNIVPPISVLIVDDNPINQTILSTFMRKKKIKYDVAKNGEEAVHKWRSGAFHLILMDIQMPVMDGIQATKEIRRLEKQSVGGFPSTPQSEGTKTPSEASVDSSRTVATPPYRPSVIIVALTASSLQADRVAALAAGCNDFLTKPVSLEWLNNKIIEWGSIKALQMWADIRPEVVKSISTGQAAQAQHVARRLHVPEGRSSASPSGGAAGRSSSTAAKTPTSTAVVATVLEKVHTPNTPLSDDSPNTSSTSLNEVHMSLSAPFPILTPEEAAIKIANAPKTQLFSTFTSGSLQPESTIEDISQAPSPTAPVPTLSESDESTQVPPVESLGALLPPAPSQEEAESMAPTEINPPPLPPQPGLQ